MALLITFALVINLAVFVSYPMSGVMGFTFLYVSAVIWTAFAIFIGRIFSQAGLFGKVVMALIFALSCAFSGLSFLPQTDGKAAIYKFLDGKYPDRQAVYLGLLRLGVDVPALLPPPGPADNKPV